MSGSIDPTKLSPADAAKVLTKAGGVVVSESQIEEDLESGAPRNADGTMHLVHYAAWLAKQIE